MGIPGWDRQTLPKKDTAYGWLQWQGTKVCITLNCTCGFDWHIDDEFVFYVQCTKCKKIFMLNGHIELVVLTEEEKAKLPKDHITY